MSIKKILFLIILIVYVAKISTAQTKDSTEYTNGYTSLCFFDNGSFRETLDCDICAPEIRSYGKYLKYKNYAYLLFTDPNDGYLIDSYVEENNNKKNETIQIELISPYEDQRKEIFFRGDSFFFQISVFYNIDSVKMKINIEDCSLLNQLGLIVNRGQCYSEPITFRENKIVIPNIEQFPVIAIEIKIYPTSPFTYYSHLETHCSITNPYSNDLKISIPKFTYYYLSYKRYYMKKFYIIDKESILDAERKMLFWNPNSKRYNNYKFNKFKIPKESIWWNVKSPYEECSMDFHNPDFHIGP